MSQQVAIVKGDSLQKLAGLGFIIGAILLLVFNSMLPRPDPSNLQNFMTAWGNKAGFVKLAELFIVVGWLGVMLGAVGVYRSIAGRGATWARLGFYGIIVGTAITIICSGLMMNMANTYSFWLGAPDASKSTMLAASIGVTMACGAVFTTYIFVEWLAIALLGIGIARSQVYPRWFGWAALVLGVLTVAAVGIPLFLVGLTSTIQTFFVVLATLTFVWALILGIWVARKAW